MTARVHVMTAIIYTVPWPSVVSWNRSEGVSRIYTKSRHFSAFDWSTPVTWLRSRLFSSEYMLYFTFLGLDRFILVSVYEFKAVSRQNITDCHTWVTPWRGPCENQTRREPQLKCFVYSTSQPRRTFIGSTSSRDRLRLSVMGLYDISVAKNLIQM